MSTARSQVPPQGRPVVPHRRAGGGFVDDRVGDSAAQPEQQGEDEDARNDQHSERERIVAVAPAEHGGEEQRPENRSGLVERLVHAERASSPPVLADA